MESSFFYIWSEQGILAWSKLYSNKYVSLYLRITASWPNHANRYCQMHSKSKLNCLCILLSMYNEISHEKVQILHLKFISYEKEFWLLKFFLKRQVFFLISKEMSVIQNNEDCLLFKKNVMWVKLKEYPMSNVNIDLCWNFIKRI